MTAEKNKPRIWREWEREEGVELCLVCDWPNHYLDAWGRAAECKERGLKVEDAFHNALDNFLDAHKISFVAFVNEFRDAAYAEHEKRQRY